MSLIQTIKRRGPLWATVHISLWLFDKFFDFVLYPASIIEFGLIAGTALMMLTSFFICWGLIVLYDLLSNNVVRDALGFETMKEAGIEVQEWIATRRLFKNWNLAPGSSAFKIVAFVYLSLWHDPMTCLILMRPKNKHSMGAHEWRVFLGSVFLSNVAWGLMVWVGVESLEALFTLFIRG